MSTTRCISVTAEAYGKLQAARQRMTDAVKGRTRVRGKPHCSIAEVVEVLCADILEGR